MSVQTAGRARRTRTRTTASVVVLGAAASVAGLGTFGTFTDSTTPVIGRLDTGVLSITLTEAAHTGPIVTDVPLLGAASLAPGGTDHLLLTASLPSTTTAELVEGATSSLDFVFSGVQRDGAAR